MEQLEPFMSGGTDGFFTKNLTPTLRTVESQSTVTEGRKKGLLGGFI